MKPAAAILIVLSGSWTWSDASAVLRGGCLPPGPTTVEVPPLPERAPPRPRLLPEVHRTEGLRIAGYGTRRQRTFRLGTSGYLCGDERVSSEGTNRALRSRDPVTLETRPGDWSRKIRIAVKRATSFRVIIDSGHPGSFDVFDFVDVQPGNYVFSLGSLGCWRGPVDVSLEFRDRVVATRTVYVKVMTHPVREHPAEKRGLRGPLLAGFETKPRER